MKLALLFPGQGAQFAGMGRSLYEQFEEVRGVFAEASDLVGEDVWSWCSDEEKLKQTQYVQPAMVALGTAITCVLTGRYGVRPHAAGGLSLGEYAALHAGGVLGAAQAVALVAKRGKLMQRVTGGAMAAVLGMERAQVEEACEHTRAEGMSVWPCNYNCPGQIVISGAGEGVDAAATILREMGARRVLPLNVSGPFHTPLMAPAADAFREVLAQAKLGEPKVPVYSNVTAQPHGDVQAMRGLLHRQITSPVRWEDTLQAMAAAGVDTFLELGPGKTVSGFVKKTLEGVTILNIEDLDGMCAVLQKLEVAL